MEMKKFLVIFKVLITIMLITNISFANNENYNDTNEIIDMQKETLKISDFINEAQQYTKESMPDIDINKLLANAIKGDIDNVKLIKLFCGLLGKEILNSVTVISSIIIIIIIHGILKSITDGLNNKSVAQITYYIQYILIVTLVMTSFAGIITMVKESIQNFVGVTSLEGTLSSSIDGITAKTTKTAVSSFIPVVGKILGDAVDTVMGCSVILKNALGIVGVIIIIGICIIPIIKLVTLMTVYYLGAALCEPIADGKIIKLLTHMGDTFKLLLAILSSVSVMLIIGITLVIKISNSGVMYN